MFRFRVIPSTITVASVLLCVKLMDLSHNTEVLAQETAPAGDKEKAPADFKPTEPAAEKTVAPTAEKPVDVPATAKPVEMPSKGAKSSEKSEKKEEGKEKEEENPALSASPGNTVDRRYTPVEVELLQNLAQRRDELDRWERNILIKESTLGATEKRIDEKITQVEAMKKEVAQLLSQYNEKEDTKIRSLVKIYENMKPKDAARIFDEVEMPILLLIIDKMSEKKVAPVLAFMDSRKAKSITVQLAEQRRINNKILTPGVPLP